MLRNSTICVLIPVHNYHDGLVRTLASLDADDTPFDILIVDDGSAVPVGVPQGPRHPTTVLRRSANGGIAAALNTGLRHCLSRGYAFIARLDAGDTIVPGRFRKQVRYLWEHPGCALVSSYVSFVDASGHRIYRYTAPTTHAAIMRRMRLNNCIVHAAAMFRAEVFASGLYTERTAVSEDYELFLRLARQHELAVIPEVLTECEYRLTGISVARRRRQQAERFCLQWRYFEARWLESYYGILRTCLAFLTPHWLVLKYKRAVLQ